MRLAVGPWFVVLAPLYDIWDAMTILPAGGHVSILLTAIAAYVAWRSRVLARRTRRLDWRELMKAVGALGVVIAWYALGAATPRPMAALRVDDPDEVVVDFHSHTDASHDGRSRFSAERNREWHRSAGFDVAYVTDHGTFAAIPSALAHNPARAGDGTVLLPGFETRFSGQHLNVIGFAAESLYGGLSPAALASFSSRSRPTGLLTLPASVENAALRAPSDGPITGIELVDGSPRGLEFGLRRRESLEALSARLHAPLIAGSNNHGWGRAAAGWTVLRIPGWRRLTPVALDAAIQATLTRADTASIRVVERKSPESVGGPVLFADVARIVRNPFRTLGVGERLAWVAWTWFGWWMMWLVGPDRRRTNLVIPSDARHPERSEGPSSSR